MHGPVNVKITDRSFCKQPSPSSKANKYSAMQDYSSLLLEAEISLACLQESARGLHPV